MEKYFLYSNEIIEFSFQWPSSLNTHLEWLVSQAGPFFIFYLEDYFL